MREANARANYLRYLTGMLLGEFAYHVQGVAIAWHVFALRHSPLDLGYIGLALFLPALILVIPAGQCSDRFERRRIVVVTQALEVACSLWFFGLVSAQAGSLLPYLTLSAAMGAVRAFGSPAERTLLPTIVSRETYMQAKAQYSAIRQLIVIGGPALGGVLTAFGLPVAITVAAIFALAGGVCIGRITVPVSASAAVRGDGSQTWQGAFDGLRFIARHGVVAGAITLDLFAVLFGGATALLPAFADGVFHLGPVGLGMLRSAPAIGAAFSAFALAKYPPRRNVGTILLTAVGGFGAATIVFGLSRNIVLSLVALVATGATDMVSVVIRNGLVQLTTPDEMRGRVTAFENIFIGASNELGAFESGLLASWIGVVPAVVFGGVGTLLVIAGWAIFFPALREADSLDGRAG